MQTAVIGGGAWGTAVATHMSRKGHRVLLWTYEPELCQIITQKRENSYYLPGVHIPDGIDVTDRLEDVAACEDIIVATPSFALRSVLAQIARKIPDKHVLILTKGLETETLFRMSEVVSQLLGQEARIAALSGPSFAKELADEVFTAVVVASRIQTVAKRFQELIHNDRLRVYTSDDVLGVELGGALKNVMAIGAGIIEGLHLGSNTQAAYITRALAEIKRLGKALGARETTFMGLSGIGDLVLTCTGPLSRNRMFGIELARGRKAEEILRSQKAVVEGYYTVGAAYRLSTSLNVEMPITEQLYQIIYQNKHVGRSLQEITRRAFKEEDA
jgi:glycerol-3-phosphate dehydrogenase (NAD(P)+)